jgi:glucokinase
VGIEKYLERLLLHLRGMLERAERPIVGIGGTFLGWIDETHSGPFLPFNAPSLNRVNLRKILENEFDLPIQLIDDSSAHTLAEFTYGSGRGQRRFMNLAMGTGITAGIILEGKPLQFTGGCAGDTGHLILRPGGPTCTAGCKGCAEALIGVEGIERLALATFGKPITAHRVIELARRGNDSRAAAIITEIGVYVGELLASLSHIFLPERISLSGGTAKAGKVLLKAVQECFEYLNGDYHRSYSSQSGGYYKGVDIVLGELKGETGMIGSVVYLFK